jgi:hypothetical protein
MNKKLFPINLILSTIILFLILITAEIFLLAWIEGSLPNSTSFPVYEFKDIAGIAWSQNPWEITKEWLAMPLLEIGYYNEMSGLPMWAIYYYLPGIISHLIVAMVYVLYFYKASIKSCSLNMHVLMFIASLLLIFSTFYLSIAAHCAGPNWILNVMLRAWQSSAVDLAFTLQRLEFEVPALYLAFQWAIAIAGIVTYGLFFREITSPENKKLIN